MFILLDDIPIDLIRKEIYKEINNLIYVNIFNNIYIIHIINYY